MSWPRALDKTVTLVTPVDAYVDSLVAALGIDGEPLDSTRTAKVQDNVFLAELRTATFNYLATPAAMSTNARLLDGDYEVPRDRWTRCRMGHGQVVHTELVNDHIDQAVADGQLFVIDSIDECVPLLMRLREALEYRLKARAWINIYLTAATEANFGLHSDTHDTIIIQLFGRKRWHVDDAAHGVPSGMTLQDLSSHEVCVGDVLAMAGETAHNVVGVGKLTLHLTIGFDRDVGLSYRLREINTLLGRGTPALSSTDQALGMAMTPDRRAGSSLPFSSTRDLADCGFVRWASRLPPLVDVDDGELIVRSGGKCHTFSGATVAMVQPLAKGEELTIDELRAISGLDDGALRAFLLAGIEEGTLICRS